MEDELISFETAKLAKEKGFTVKCLNKFYDLAGEMQMQYGSGKYWMDEEGEEWQPEILGCTHTGIGERTITNTYERPTQSLLQRWFREVHKIDIVVTMSEFSRTYGYKIYYIEDTKTVCINNMFVKKDTYEQALEAGLQEAPKLIKE